MTEAMIQRARGGRLKKKSEFVRVMKQLSYNRGAMIGLFIFLLELVIVLLAPVLAPYKYDAISSAVREAPSLAHLCGTDDLGRDILSRILYGGRYSITMGIFSVMIAVIFSSVIGSVAGYFGGRVDNIIMRVLDVIQSLPGMLLTIVMSAVLGSGYFNTILALSVNCIPGQARMLRAQMMKNRDAEYVEASRSINCSKLRIIAVHLFPNSFSPLIVQMTMGVANMILMASSLSFIGLGVQPPIPEWGAMLAGSREFFRASPHMVVFPGLAIAITILALNLLGDGLRDALDPKLKK